MRIYSPRGYLNIKVQEYSIPIRSNITSSYTRSMAIHYPVSYIQGAMDVTALTRSRTEAQNIIKFIRQHHKDIQKNPQNTLKIVDSKKGINFRGICPTVVDLRSLENYAPLIPLSFLLTQDLLSEVTTSSSSGSEWSKIYADDQPVFDPGGIRPSEAFLSE